MVETPTYDPTEERETQARAWKLQIEAELEDDLMALDDEMQVRNAHYRTRASMVVVGGTIRDLKRVMNRADIAAIPYEMLWYFLNESGHSEHWVPAHEVRQFLQVGPRPGEKAHFGSASAGAASNEPSSVALAPQRQDGLVEPAPAPPRKPKLSRAAIDAAIRAFLSDPANRGYRDSDILDAIRAAHPGHRIPRDDILNPLRAIAGRRKRGPKPIRGESSRN